jgi:hypothetical protein
MLASMVRRVKLYCKKELECNHKKHLLPLLGLSPKDIRDGNSGDPSKSNHTVIEHKNFTIDLRRTELEEAGKANPRDKYTFNSVMYQNKINRHDLDPKEGGAEFSVHAPEVFRHIFFLDTKRHRL